MLKIENTEVLGWEHAIHGMRNPMNRLRNAGTDHRKFMRMITVYVDLTGPLYWWKEFDTYKVGTVANSCSTMHKIAAKEFTLEDFSYEHFMGMTDNQYKGMLLDQLEDWQEVLDLAIKAGNTEIQEKVEKQIRKINEKLKF